MDFFILSSHELFWWYCTKTVYISCFYLSSCVRSSWPARTRARAYPRSGFPIVHSLFLTDPLTSIIQLISSRWQFQFGKTFWVLVKLRCPVRSWIFSPAEKALINPRGVQIFPGVLFSGDDFSSFADCERIMMHCKNIFRQDEEDSS